MKGTFADFLRLVAARPELARELETLAARFDFEFTSELRDEDLDGVTGGFAAPFIPGGAVISAAISGLGQLKDSGSSGGLGSVSGG